MAIDIYRNLAWLNGLPEEAARDEFLACCGSTGWAEVMTASRPFRMLEDLYECAEKKWFALPPSDWLEAFAAHPKIGSKRPAAAQSEKAASWSADEQSGAASMDANVTDELSRLNSLYEEKFGFIFIVCASGKTAGEMLAILKARIGNSVDTELKLAAVEQQKITELRLNKLLER